MIQSNISFVQNDSGLLITVKTERLYMRSVTSDDAERYYSLFCNALLVEKFGTGVVRTKKEVDELVKDVWAERWKRNNPYSGYAVFERTTDDFVGHIHFSSGDTTTPGQTEIGYIFLKAHWGKGYGTEVARAAVHDLAPQLARRGYTLNGEKLRTIAATARVDNEGSIKILKKIGMQQIGTIMLYDAERHLFSIKIVI